MTDNPYESPHTGDRQPTRRSRTFPVLAFLATPFAIASATFGTCAAFGDWTVQDPAFNHLRPMIRKLTIDLSLLCAAVAVLGFAVAFRWRWLVRRYGVSDGVSDSG